MSSGRANKVGELADVPGTICPFYVQGQAPLLRLSELKALAGMVSSYVLNLFGGQKHGPAWPNGAVAQVRMDRRTLVLPSIKIRLDATTASRPQILRAALTIRMLPGRIVRIVVIKVSLDL